MSNYATTNIIKYFDTFLSQMKIILQCFHRLYIMQKYHRVVCFADLNTVSLKDANL